MPTPVEPSPELSSPSPGPPRPSPSPPPVPRAAGESGRRTWVWVTALLLGLLLVPFLLALVARLFVFQAYFIPSGAMLPTLEVEDRVLVNKRSYSAGDVGRGDIVVFTRTENTLGRYDDLVKRVVALPGETVTLREGRVEIDGLGLQESYLLEPDSTFPSQGMPGCAGERSATECTVPDGHVFVLGDNRRGSTDSRVFGPIPTDTIVGRAFLKVYPDFESL